MKMFSTTMIVLIVLISNWSPMRSMTRFPVINVKKYSMTRKLSIITNHHKVKESFCDTCGKKNVVKKVKFDFLCWKIMSLTDQNCVVWRWALSFAQHTPVSAAFKNQTMLCHSNLNLSPRLQVNMINNVPC